MLSCPEEVSGGLVGKMRIWLVYSTPPSQNCDDDHNFHKKGANGPSHHTMDSSAALSLERQDSRIVAAIQNDCVEGGVIRLYLTENSISAPSARISVLSRSSIRQV